MGDVPLEVQKKADEAKATERASRCDQCGHKPDTLYMNSESGEILAVICDPCREAFNNAFKSVFGTCCDDLDCDCSDPVIKKRV